MSESKIEEIISALWLIAGLMAISIEWNVFGWILIAKAALDKVCCLFFALKEIREEKQP